MSLTRGNYCCLITVVPMVQKKLLACFGLAVGILFAVPPDVQGEFFGIPLSDTLFTFEVKVPGSECISVRDSKSFIDKLLGSNDQAPAKIKNCPQVATREGTLFHIQDTTNGYWYGFIVVREAKGGVSVSRFSLTQDRIAGQAVVQDADKPQLVQVGGEASFPFSKKPAAPKIRLELLGEEEGSFPNSPPYTDPIDSDNHAQAEFLRLIYGDPSASICCVGCGPIRVCGDSVNLGCGACGGGGGGYGQI
ncbi:MAG: hypothetical protein ABJC13_05415 [Acidobacteriota bacterium]